MLGLAQQRARIKSELSRRIGYTNGLHDIFRFARVVSYLHSIGPASGPSLRSAIIEQEAVRGPKYADGVIDAGRALGLIHKAGTKLTLSDKGYALYALQQMNGPDDSTTAILLHAVLESDGEATLNLLDILSSARTSDSLGGLLVQRLLHILTIRETWAQQRIESKFVRDMILQELSDAKRRLATAVDTESKQTQSWSAYREDRSLNPQQKVERFYAHTVNPRRGWLKDLGCIQERNRESYWLTEAGQRLLSCFKEADCYSDSVFILPFSVQVGEFLGLSDFVGSRDLCWRATASFFVDPPSPVDLSPEEQLHFIEAIYPHVRFHVFNEASVDSLFDVLAAQLAIKGKYVEWDAFSKMLETVFQEFPDKVYRLRQRHGGSGYIGIKSTVA